ncbi:beta-ketoacyl synthase N-terminal-like domain-containing protein [Candidatus Profftella armatura]
MIGLSGMFPKSKSVDIFWKALDSDISLIEEIPESRFNWRNVYDKNL